MPIIFLEFARQRDFIQASLLLLLGIFLIISSDIFRIQQIMILTINSLIITLLVYEVFSNRWAQLSKTEKKEFLTIESIKFKLMLFFDSIKKLFLNVKVKFLKPNISRNNLPTKKWVRTLKKDSNSDSDQLKFNSSSLDVKATNNPKKDIIKDEKI